MNDFKSSLPKMNYLYFKNLLDLVFMRFFDDFNLSFSKSSDGSSYIFSSSMSRVALKDYFLKTAKQEIFKIVEPWTIASPSWWIVIGSCYPSKNLILDYRLTNEYFPSKLAKFLEKHPTTRWIIRESGIDLDIDLINEILWEVFIDFLSKKIKLGSEYKNVLFVVHDRLDCYTIFKLLKWMYGKSSCVNLYEKKNMNEMNLPLVSINELLSKYIHNKTKMNSSRELKTFSAEIKQYVDSHILFLV